MFVEWLDVLVFDLKSRVATLKRSKKRAQKAFLRVHKEEKKSMSSAAAAGASAKKATNKRDLKMLRALEDFWGVELNETEKSLERARATLKAHKLMLTDDENKGEDEEKGETNHLKSKAGEEETTPKETTKEAANNNNNNNKEEATTESSSKQREQTIFASAVAFYRTSLGLATPVRHREA